MRKSEYMALATAAAVGALIGGLDLDRNTGYAVGVAAMAVIFAALIVSDRRTRRAR